MFSGSDVCVMYIVNKRYVYHSFEVEDCYLGKIWTYKKRGKLYTTEVCVSAVERRRKKNTAQVYSVTEVLKC